jgi:hypothetical protein
MTLLIEKEESVNETFYPDYTTLGDQARRRAGALPNSRPVALPRSILEGAALRERIAGTAYELYVQRGGAPGHDVEDWLKAEQRVLDELKLRALGKTVTSFRARLKRLEKA